MFKVIGTTHALYKIPYKLFLPRFTDLSPAGLVLPEAIVARSLQSYAAGKKKRIIRDRSPSSCQRIQKAPKKKEKKY